MRPVSIVTVANSGFFFLRLLVQRVRETVGERPYEIVVVDRGRRSDGRRWLEAQPDVRVLTWRQ